MTFFKATLFDTHGVRHHAYNHFYGGAIRLCIDDPIAVPPAGDRLEQPGHSPVTCLLCLAAEGE